jgi:hypothetical protein
MSRVQIQPLLFCKNVPKWMSPFFWKKSSSGKKSDICSTNQNTAAGHLHCMHHDSKIPSMNSVSPLYAFFVFKPYFWKPIKKWSNPNAATLQTDGLPIAFTSC